MKRGRQKSEALIYRRLEYQLQLGSFSLNKSPTEVGTLNAVQSGSTLLTTLKQNHELTKSHEITRTTWFELVNRIPALSAAVDEKA